MDHFDNLFEFPPEIYEEEENLSTLNNQDSTFNSNLSTCDLNFNNNYIFSESLSEQSSPSQITQTNNSNNNQSIKSLNQWMEVNQIQLENAREGFEKLQQEIEEGTTQNFFKNLKRKRPFSLFQEQLKKNQTKQQQKQNPNNKDFQQDLYLEFLFNTVPGNEKQSWKFFQQNLESNQIVFSSDRTLKRDLKEIKENWKNYANAEEFIQFKQKRAKKRQTILQEDEVQRIKNILNDAIEEKKRQELNNAEIKLTKTELLGLIPEDLKSKFREKTPYSYFSEYYNKKARTTKQQQQQQFCINEDFLAEKVDYFEYNNIQQQMEADDNIDQYFSNQSQVSSEYLN